jgi:hypothetical protein
VNNAFYDSISVITNCTYATMSESNIMAYVTIRSHFASQLIMSNLFSVLIVFRWFFTWLALSDVDIHFSISLIRKFNDEKKETTYHQSTQSLLVIDGVIMTPISASLLQKASAATDRLCQIALNRKLSLYAKIGVDFEVY